MKMKHCFAVLFLSLNLVNTSLAQQNQEPQVMRVKTDDPNVDIPLGVDTTPTDAVASNYVTKLRQAVQKMEMEEAESQKAAGGKVTMHRFTKESATFFLAIAAVQIQGLIIHYADNPSALQQHLESIKDPIAHISFYLFMVANGHTVNFLQKRTAHLEPAAQRAAMRRISYLGMSAGSLVSGLSSEVLTMLKDCGTAVFMPSKREEVQNQNLAVCDAALRSWTLNKKVQQYIPQIVSLLASTEAAKFVEVVGKGGTKFTKAGLAKLLATQKGKIFKFAAIQIGTTVTPSGIAIKSYAFLGKFMQFAGFTYLDHLINPYVQKLFGNTFKPMQFAYDKSKFEEAVAKSKEYKWTNQRANVKVAEEIRDLTELMSSWREQQLTKFNLAHSVWGENTLKIIEHTQVTYGFYKSYIENLFATLKTGHQIKIGNWPKTSMVNVTYYPFRTLPLYGIRLTDPLKEGYSSQNDLYFEKPSELEPNQLKTVKTVNQQLKQILFKVKLSEQELRLAAEITQTFDKENLTAIGETIARINAITDGAYPSIGAEFRKILRGVRAMLGDPRPILTPGLAFSYAYEIYSFHTSAMEGFDPNNAGDNKGRSSDYLWFKMACGADEQFYTNAWGMTPKFYAPKLIKKDLHLGNFCTPSYANSARDYRGNKLLPDQLYDYPITASNGKTYKGINDLVYNNLRPEIIGDFTSEKGQNNFGPWWEANVKVPMVSLFKQFDAEYMNVLVELTGNWHNPTTYLDRINQSKYLGKDVLENMSFELHLYASILNDIMYDKLATPTEQKPFGKMHPLFASKQSTWFQTIAAMTPAVLEDKKGLFGRFKDAAAADIYARKFQGEATRLRAAATAAAQKLEAMKEEAKTKEINLAPFEQEFKRADAAAVKAEAIARQPMQIAKEKGKDISIVRGEQPQQLKAIADLVDATQERIALLRRVRVTKNGSRFEIQNFPSKEEAEAALDKSTDAMEAMAEMVKKLDVQGLDESQNLVITAAADGMQSVLTEVGRLTMSLYTSKYKLDDDYKQAIDQRKASQTDKKKAMKTGSATNLFKQQ